MEINLVLRIFNRLFPFLFVGSLLIIVSCAKKSSDQNPYPLIVGQRTFTLAEFRRNYELDPAFPGYVKGEQGLKEYAEALADRILAAKRADD